MPCIACRPTETAAEFGEIHHRSDHLKHIALDEKLPAWLQSSCNGHQQSRLKHPPFAVAPFEPWVRELNRDPLQLIGRQGCHPSFEADVGVAEQHADVAEPACQSVTVRGDHQWPADLDAKVVPVRIPLRQTQQAAASGTADVEMDRLLGFLEQVAGCW